MSFLSIIYTLLFYNTFANVLSPQPVNFAIWIRYGTRSIFNHTRRTSIVTIYPVLPLAYKTHPSHSLSATNIAHTRSYKQPLCVDYIDSHSLQKRHDNTLYTINCCHIPIYSTLRDSRRFPLGHSTLCTCFSLIHTDKNMNPLLFHETTNVHHQCYFFMPVDSTT